MINIPGAAVRLIPYEAHHGISKCYFTFAGKSSGCMFDSRISVYLSNHSNGSIVRLMPCKESIFYAIRFSEHITGR